MSNQNGFFEHVERRFAFLIDEFGFHVTERQEVGDSLSVEYCTDQVYVRVVFPIRSVQFAKHEKRIEREGFRSLASPTKVPSMSPLFSPSSVAKFAGANAARATNG